MHLTPSPRVRYPIRPNNSCKALTRYAYVYLERVALKLKAFMVRRVSPARTFDWCSMSRAPILSSRLTYFTSPFCKSPTRALGALEPNIMDLLSKQEMRLGSSRGVESWIPVPRLPAYSMLLGTY
jgi:hypothetical protein